MFPESLRVDLDVAYNEAMKPTVNSDWRRLIEVVPTTSSAKVETFYGDKGRLRRMRGERQPQKFNEYKQTITLDEWEMTMTVKRDVLADDPSGSKLRQMVTDFGTEVASSLEAETWEFLRKGVSITGFDGANLFSESHVYKTSTGVTLGSVQSNLHRGGSQLDATTLRLTQQAMAQWTTDQGKPLGARVTDVVVRRGSLNAKTARELANSQFTVEASTAKGTMTENIFRGSFNIVEVDYGFGATEWAALDLSAPSRKPIKVLSHSTDAGFDSLEFSQLTEDSENGFWRNEYAFGVYGRFDWNPGYWYTAYLHGASDYTSTDSDLERVRVKYPNA